MKFQHKPHLLFLFIFVFVSHLLIAQTEEETYEVSDHYNKKEVKISMRDGVQLHTTIYSPKDTSQKYPILLQSRRRRF